MTVPEQFSLRWNDFQTNLSQGIHTFLECEDLVDVTLAAGGEFMRAHKLILSICSPYFKSLFKAYTCEHPIVIIKDVQPEQLRQMLQFMYSGEVNIHRQDLSAFLQTAELLQIKGLTTSNKCEPDKANRRVSTETNNVNSKLEENKTIQANKPQIINPPTSNCLPQKRLSVKDGPDPNKKMKKEKDGYNLLCGYVSDTSSGSEQYVDMDSMYQTENDFSEEWATKYVLDTSEPRNDKDVTDWTTKFVLDPSERMKKEDWAAKFGLDSSEPRVEKEGWKAKVGGVKCPSCNRIFANRYNLKVHIRDKHDTLEGTLKCHICNKSMRNPSCLRVHLYHHRKQAAFLNQSNLDQSGTSTGINEDSDEIMIPETPPTCGNGTAANLQ